MKPAEELRQLEEVSAMTIGTPDNVAKMFALYRLLINPKASLCANCSGSIRQAHANLVNYYHLNKERLKKEIKLEELKNNGNV